MAKTWKERREEEARILAEMEKAMQERAQENVQENEQDGTDGQAEKDAPSKAEKPRYHCSKCGTLMQENGVCPNCGHRIYVPMEEGKQKTAQLIIGAACIVIFLLVYFIFAK